MRFPVRMRIGTPAQRQLSISSRSRAGGDAVDVAEPVVLAADVRGRVGIGHRAEHRELGVVDGRRVAPRRWLHGRHGDDLQQMVDHDVAQCPDRVVEVAAVLDPEALGHRDLQAGDVVTVPDRLDHRVGEAQVQDLVQAHLPEEVIDPQQPSLGDVAVQIGGQLTRRGEVVAEGLLHDDPRRRRQRTRSRQPCHDRAEQARRNLEVEHRHGGGADGGLDALEGRRLGEIARHVGEPAGESPEDLTVDRLAGRLDRLPRVLPQVLDGPVLGSDAHDRAIQQPPLLEPVERAQRHLAGEVAGDPEDHQRIGRRHGRVLAVGGHDGDDVSARRPTAPAASDHPRVMRQSVVPRRRIHVDTSQARM
jgi:hypothetical protein